MDLKLTGKVALVTGSSRGIGASIAEGLAAEGCDVMLTGRDEAALKEVAAAVARHGRKAHHSTLDLSDPKAPASLVADVKKHFGKLDILVNNAGATKRGDFRELTDADWRDGFELKFFAHVRLAREAWPLLVASKGSVIGIAGIGGKEPEAEFGIGSSVNAACMAWTKALADVGKKEGVQVNCVNPGRVETERLWRRIRGRVQDSGQSEAKVREEFQKEFNITRFGLVEDIAGLIAFLASPHGRWMHSAIIDMDGGEVRGVLMNILLTPARIGSVEIRNRIVMPPMTTRLADKEGRVTDDTVNYYMARVRGGVGLVTVEMASPERAGRHRLRELGIYDDQFLSGLSRLTAEIHRGGGKCSIQLGHGGGHTRFDICGETPVAPSSIPHPVYEVTNQTIVPRSMTAVDIHNTVHAFAAAAARAEKAGFDVVEIHAAHGYLISQFLTPFENRRTDQYGGDLENRARMGLEVLRACKAAVKIPVIYRLSVDDYFPEGLQYAEGKQVALWAAAAGADALHIAAGHYRSLPSAARMIPPMNYPDATFLAYAAAVKKEVSIPVIAVGRLGDPEVAAEAIEMGKADFIALGRTSIAEPEWVAKLTRGEPARRCLACNTCVNEMRGGSSLRCVVNGRAGRETDFLASQTPQGERIAVIGAGPAGLTYASLVADGNTVTVFEREAVAGGAFLYAGKAPLFQEVNAVESSFDRYVAAQTSACARKGVIFQFNTDVAKSPDVLAPFDRIVIASGAKYRYGLGPLARLMLDWGAARWPGIAQVFKNEAVRDWFYHRARAATGDALKALAKPEQKVMVIGDALKAGKSRPAIASAFEAALLGAPRPAGS